METVWKKAVGKPPELPKKKCEAENCAAYFKPTWPTARRCDRCRKEKRPYKQVDSPF